MTPETWVFGGLVAITLLHLVAVVYLRRARAFSHEHGSGQQRDGTSGVSRPDTVHCRECGTDNETGYRFCRECIAKLPGSAVYTGHRATPRSRGVR